MNPLTFADLISPDPRTLPFGPFGLGGQLPPDSAVDYQQAVITGFDLADSVPDHTRRAFERLQQMHIYGVLYYELFTVVDSQAMLVLDLALAERFLDFYGGVAPFVVGAGPDKGASRPLPYQTWNDVYDALRSGAHARLLLSPRSGATPFRFTGMFDSLLRWARIEGLLIGQRNRRLDRILHNFRTNAAHPRFTGTVMPVNSARSILDLAEIINQLWGHPTPGGRLYPTPLERPIVIVGWTTERRWTQFELFKLPEEPLTETTFIALRAVPDDDLTIYHSIYETTRYPTELLWGPGNERDLRAWASAAPNDVDTVTYLDRLFLVRTRDDAVDPPMRPNVAAGRTGRDRNGHWHLVRADYPNDAYGHVQQRVSQKPPTGDQQRCTRVGQCANCAVDVLSTGHLDTMIHTLQDNGVAVTRERPGSVAVPSPFSWRIPAR
jgi:hypothetical protein